MELTSGLTVVRRFWRSILVVTVLAGVVAYAISFLMSPQYAATSRLLVRAREARFLTSTGQGLSQQPGVIDSVLAKSLGQTTAATIGSRAVAERVVPELHLDQPRPQDPSFIPSAKRAIRQLYRVVTAIIRYGYYDEPSAYEGAVQAVQAS